MLEATDKAIAALVHAPKRKKIKEEVNYCLRKEKRKLKEKGKGKV